MTKIDRIPRLHVECAAAIELSVLLHHDNARSGGDHDRFFVVHLAPGEGIRRDVGALMVVAVGLIVGPRAAVVVAQLVRIRGIIVDEVGDRARAFFGMARHEPQRPLQRNERRGFGRKFRRERGQAARLQQRVDVARDRRVDPRAFRRRDLIGWQRCGAAAYRTRERGLHCCRQRAERDGRRQ